MRTTPALQQLYNERTKAQAIKVAEATALLVAALAPKQVKKEAA